MVYTRETSKSILFKDTHQALEENCGKLTLFRALLWEIPVFINYPIQKHTVDQEYKSVALSAVNSLIQSHTRDHIVCNRA